MGPFSGSPSALLSFPCLTNSFGGGNNSFCNSEPWLPARWMGWSKHCPTTAPWQRLGWGKRKQELYPRLRFLLEPLLTNQPLILLLAALPASGKTKPGQAASAVGLLISAGKQKEGEEISLTPCSPNCRKKIPQPWPPLREPTHFLSGWGIHPAQLNPLPAASCRGWKSPYHSKLPAASQVPKFVQALAWNIAFFISSGLQPEVSASSLSFSITESCYAQIPPALAADTEEGNLPKLASLLVRKNPSSLGSRCQTNSWGATKSQDPLPLAWATVIQGLKHLALHKTPGWAVPKFKPCLVWLILLRTITCPTLLPLSCDAALELWTSGSRSHIGQGAASAPSPWHGTAGPNRAVSNPKEPVAHRPWWKLMWSPCSPLLDLLTALYSAPQVTCAPVRQTL